MVHVLLGHVRVVPEHLLLETAGLRIMFQLDDLSPYDPFEPVQHDAGPQPIERI